MTDRAGEVGRAWSMVAARLPEGWTLDGLRCASSGIQPGSRSEDWVAVAAGPNGTQRTHRASDPVAALDGLAASLADTSLDEG